MKSDVRIVLLASVLALQLGACSPDRDQTFAAGAIGDVQAGHDVIGRQACGSCHSIPGVSRGHGKVGPPLGHFGRQTVIAGVLPNTPANLVLWLRNPQGVVPGDAMPDIGLSERQARDVAAYLYTLR